MNLNLGAKDEFKSKKPIHQTRILKNCDLPAFLLSHQCMHLFCATNMED